jgi:LPS-assembly protein
MSASKHLIIKIIIILSCSFPVFANPIGGISSTTLAQQLGWVESDENNCGGYYLEPPFNYPIDNNNLIAMTGNEGLIAKRYTSVLEGKVTITRAGQQITTNKLFLHRDPTTFKFSEADLIGNVHLREPNTLIVAKEAHYNFKTNAKSLTNTLYRTSLAGKELVGPKIPEAELRQTRKVTAMTAWGKAYKISQEEPKVYELEKASYSTCPPINPSWRVKASHIVLNKNTGRGYATNARLFVKNIPVLYFPYVNFPIDSRRKTGFLWPSYGGNSKSGPSIFVPFYWNIAPNYDLVTTPAFLSKRGTQMTNNFRYLIPTNSGRINFAVLPNDKYFARFRNSSAEKAGTLPTPQAEADLQRLIRDSNNRKAFLWRDDARYNQHWSSHVDFNYAGDDYYLRDFGGNLNEISQNTLLQEGDLYYKSEHWDFTGRVQSYQTLHPFDEVAVQNVYRRFPQLILNASYPGQAFGLEYFINNEATNFDFLKTPGTTFSSPIGTRLHTQPGISLPLYWPYFYVNPRVQLALTQYNLRQTNDFQIPNVSHRSLPIFEIASGLSLNRNTRWFNHYFLQTLEPQIYYTYIPYHNQDQLPLFDTSLNILTYDQIFRYNRFSGIDRIGDANQIGIGITTRFIDQDSGFEKIRANIGEIVYFSRRKVLLCSGNSCQVVPLVPNRGNDQRLSSISGTLQYNVNPAWSFTTYGIWNPISKQLDNSTVGFHYQPDAKRIINLGFNYARGGDSYSGVITNNPADNLKGTDISAAWPVTENVNVLGRWSQNWNHAHLQNLLYGVEYDTCCWAMRLVGGRAFTNVDPNNNNKPQYNNEFYIQFALKGLGNFQTGNPAGSLSNISGYNTQFGQKW